MATEHAMAFPFSVESMVEDVLQRHGGRLNDLDLACRKAEEASLRRYEAAGWLRKMVGVVGGKDLPAEPSEDGFRLGLRSGIILCNVLNKVQPGTIPKVVEGPCDSGSIPDGAALSVYQYFENVRNFLVSMEELALPTFEASDLEQGGKTTRVVNCVLALKAYSEWKQGGGSGSWKFGGGSLKPASSGKYYIRKTLEPFMNSFSRTSSASEKCLENLSSEQCLQGDTCSDLISTRPAGSLNVLVRQILADKKQEEIPLIVESLLSKVMEEFEHRLAPQIEQIQLKSQVNAASEHVKVEGQKVKMSRPEKDSNLKDNRNENLAMREKDSNHNDNRNENLDVRPLHQKFEKQHENIEELRQNVRTAKAGMELLQIQCMEEFHILGQHLQGLSRAASGYQKVLEENRKLYNEVQDLKGNIRVYCRVRPCMGGLENRHSVVDRFEEGNIVINTPLKHGKEARKSFTFNKVFGPTATQAEVFSDTQPLVRSVLDGYNVCIFAYGQTGSGKTYTMSGPKELTEDTMGVNYRALGDLFLLSEQRKDTITYGVSVQMIEIYNEQVRDLLVTDGTIKRLEIRNSSHKGINVPDANIVPVYSSSDVMYLMNLGLRNRAVSSTALNDRSSRSHSCLTVHVQGRELTKGTILRGCMHLVDLAGSERVDKSEVTGDRLKEAQHINRSLSALGDVIAALAQKNSHVPYRNSKLTQLLQDALGGQAKTLMFVHISPEPDALGETISTLKFAERVSTVELGAAQVNKDGTEVKELREQIAILKAALAKKDGAVELVHNSRFNSPDSQETNASFTLPSSWSGSDLVSAIDRQPMEDVGNIQNYDKSVSKPKGRCFDGPDLLANSPPWLPVSSPSLSIKDDDRESESGEWVDKVMVKRHDGENRGESPRVWEAGNPELPNGFYQSCRPDSSKIYPEVPSSRFTVNSQNNQGYDVLRSQQEIGSDDLDELEVGTHDSSETELHWQYNPSRPMNNAVAAKHKRSQAKNGKNGETRSVIPAPAVNPLPSRKLANRHAPNSRLPVPIDARRQNGRIK